MFNFLRILYFLFFTYVFYFNNQNLFLKIVSKKRNKINLYYSFPFLDIRITFSVFFFT